MTVKEVKQKIESFLFQSEPLEQLGLFRIILCGTLFYIACWRQMNIDQLGALALIPRDVALDVFPVFYRPLIQWFFWPDSMVSIVHLLLILLLGLATLGLTNRPLLLLAWAINQGMLNRNYAIMFGADTIGNLFLFYLAFTNCADFYSLKSRFFKIKSQVSDLSSIFYRLCQVQICVIYAYTGFEKLKGNTWWDGTALWTVFANPQFSVYDFKFLSAVPWFFAFATFTTIIFEVYFPAMMLNKKLKNIWLLSGFVFHISIGVLLGLMTFSLIMLSTYVLFVDRIIIRQFLDRFYKARPLPNT